MEPVLFKQKFYLRDDMAMNHPRPKLILILEPEEYLVAIYGRYFLQPHFRLKTLGDMHEEGPDFSPDLLIINTDAYFEWLVKLKKDFPNLPVISIGDSLTAGQLKQLMSYGVTSHINKKFSRPNDMVTLTKTILMFNQ